MYVDGSIYNKEIQQNELKLSTIKKVSIIGDSVSTFNKDGFKIVGYEMFYPTPNSNDHAFDVKSVEDTWWKQVINITGGIIDKNASYSGSGATSIDGMPDFQSRVPLLGNPDVIYVALGYNDWDTGVQIGSIDYDTEFYDLTKFAPAYIKGIKDTIKQYPNAQIVCITFGNISKEYQDTIKNISNHYGLNYIYVGEFGGLHPNKNEMKSVSEKIYKYLLNVDKNEYCDSEEWSKVTLDSENKILEGFDIDGNRIINTDLNINGSIITNKNIKLGKVSLIGDSIGTSTYNKWFYKIVSENDGFVELNNSIASSTVTNMFIGFYQRTNNIGNPDTVIVELGTNDSFNNVTIGNEFDYNKNIEQYDDSIFIDAYIKGIKGLFITHPNSDIICLIMNMDDSYANVIKTISEHYNLLCIDCRGYEDKGDHVHPSQNGVNFISNVINDKIIKSGFIYIDDFKPKFDSILGKNDIIHYYVGDFYKNMSKLELINLYNEKLKDFATLCRCNVESFYRLSINDTDDIFYWKINHNFRRDAIYKGISKEQIVSQLNKYFAIPVYRFQDAKIGNPNVYELGNRNKVNKSRYLNYYNRHEEYVNMEDYSQQSFLCMTDCVNVPPMTNGVLANQWKIVERNDNYPLWETNHTYHSPFSFGTEPSALLVDNGNKIRLYSAGGIFSETEDGINWSTPTEIINREVLGGHPSVNIVDGLYMWVGYRKAENNNEEFTLCTSEDGITFTYRGIIKGTKNGISDIGNGHSMLYLGNTYLFKDYDGTYYLFYEGYERNNPEHPDWEICLMTCTDLFVDNGDGTIGNWVQCAENPIIPSLKAGAKGNYYPGWTAPGNPEIVKGEDNQPLKYDGKYYMYYHIQADQDNSHLTVNSRIERAYSYDLVHWISEGSIIASRDVPEWGDNSDQALCQFKGRTYLFYTVGVNSGIPRHMTDNLRCVVDDRPLVEMLKIKP